jgi:D-glycero-D-manno-heptose 1,7-bisphosphate phosphatase
MSQTVTMIVGAQASSKSTLTKELLKQFPSTEVLNRDSEGGKIVDLLPKLEAHLINKKDVILDNTFPTVEVRNPFIELCRKYNVNINCKLMDTSIEDCAFNAIQRAIEILGKFPSPEEIKKSKHTNIFPPAVLFKYRKEFQKPSLEEGFLKVETIKFTRKDDKAFTSRALFLDFDGTLRECINGNGKFPISKDQIEIKPNVSKILKEYKDKGYILLGVSNQSGVHKKELEYDQCDDLFKHTNKLIGFDIDYKFCPHQSSPIICYCRKPGVGFGVEFIMKYKLSRKDSLMVGDFTSDATFAKRCGFQYIDQKDFFA